MRLCLLYAWARMPLFLFFLQGQHGAAACRRAAQAQVGCLEFLGDLVVEHQAVVEGSEEHTSELQSLMRISYAVFCLKKTKINKHTQHRTSNLHASQQSHNI